MCFLDAEEVLFGRGRRCAVQDKGEATRPTVRTAQRYISACLSAFDQYFCHLPLLHEVDGPYNTRYLPSALLPRKSHLLTNADIARHFRELARLMEFHQDNPFKIRSYNAAYNKLRKIDQPLAAQSEAELQQLPGIGKNIAAKILELATTGQLKTLVELRERTPPGLQEMLTIRGFGPRKVRAVHEGLGVTTVGQLLYAINENRLVELKGFGAKTQETLREKLEFYQRSSGQYLYRTLDEAATRLEQAWAAALPEGQIMRTGALRRACPTLTHLAFITPLAPADLRPLPHPTQPEKPLLEDWQTTENVTRARFDDFPVVIHHCTVANFGSKQFRHTGTTAFLQAFVAAFPDTDFSDLPSEDEVFARVNCQPVPPELREDATAIPRAKAHQLPELLALEDIQGVVHCHSTWSDGIHSLAQMAEAARTRGYAYLIISDHSQSAFYANGLSPARVREQWAEIDALNEKMAPFRIFKSIESDILADGSLDYPDELLAGFDLVIASVHSNLQMDEEKATQRLLTAIANPHTRILGHPTGRLLLSRAGYPIDHQRVIDACAEHDVVIELNANPYRLDLDWSWIPYAMEKGVQISINPDAHAMGGIDDIRFGVLAARKGGLTPAYCWNTRWPG